jgi:glycosyltransferase involved in cell wall biosynthesis
MIEIFSRYREHQKKGKFLILTTNVAYAERIIPENKKEFVLIKKVLFDEVPMYLSAADIAFSLRIPRYSMRGVFPIKLAEYLLMGLPVITSKGIGDTEDLLKEAPGCFVFNHFSTKSMHLVNEFLLQAKELDQNKIRAFAVKNFSLEKCANQYIKTFNKLS